MRNFQILTLTVLMACGSNPSKKQHPSPEPQQQVDAAPRTDTPSPAPEPEQSSQVENQSNVDPESQATTPQTTTPVKTEPESPTKRVKVKHAGIVYEAELRGNLISPMPDSVEYNVAIADVAWPSGNLLFLSSGATAAESCKAAKANRAHYLNLHAGVVTIMLKDYPHSEAFGDKFIEDAMQQLQIADLKFSPRTAIKTWLRLRPNSISSSTTELNSSWTQLKNANVAGALSNAGRTFVDMNLAMYCDIELGNVSLAFIW